MNFRHESDWVAGVPHGGHHLRNSGFQDPSLVPRPDAPVWGRVEAESVEYDAAIGRLEIDPEDLARIASAIDPEKAAKIQAFMARLLPPTTRL